MGKENKGKVKGAKKIKAVKIKGLPIPLPSKAIDKQQAIDRVGRAIEKSKQPQLYQVMEVISHSYVKMLKNRGLFQKGGRRHYDYEVAFTGDEQALIDGLIQKASDAGDVFAEDLVSTQNKYLPIMADIILPRSKDDDTSVRVRVYVMIGVPALYTAGSKSNPAKAKAAKKKLNNLPEVE